MPYSDNPSEKASEDRLYSEPLLPTTVAPSPDPKLSRRKKIRRVFRILHVLTLIGIVVHLASRTSLFQRMGLKCHGRQSDALAVQLPHQIGDWDYDIPHHIHLAECAELSGAKDVSNIQGSTDPNDIDSVHTSTVHFDLPLSSANLFFVSRGQNLGGIAIVETSEDQAEDIATVEISIYYNVQEALDWTKVCLLERQENENGVGIFTPNWGRQRHPDNRERRLTYAIKVILPTSAAGESPLQIKSLETDLINTSHRLESSGEDVFFDSVNLRATNGIFQVKDLATRVGTIASTNGKITGKFNATESLILKTTNGPIDVDVTLTYVEQSSNATLVAHTTNSPLKASINLLSSSETGGSFYVITEATNGPLAVKFPTAPVDSKLDLSASTTNSPAAVSLHETYEGVFSLQTSRFFRPKLVVKNEVEDPAGKGRVRRVDTKSARGGELSGEVSWDEESKNVGVVKVSTTNSPIALEV